MYGKRVKKVMETLKKSGCDALFVDDSTNIRYLTGLELSSAKLLLFAKGVFLIVDGRYLEVCKKNSPFRVLLDKQGKGLESALSHKACAAIKTLGISGGRVFYRSFIALRNRVRSLGIKIKALDDPVEKVRFIKDSSEIDIMRKVAKLGSLGFDRALAKLKEGVKERDLALEIEFFWRRRGAEGVAFESIIAFGANSSMPHYQTGTKKLKRGDVVLIDIGARLKGYCSDMTRTVFFGQPKEEMVKVYGIVKEAQKRALALCRPGIKIGELDKAARDYITEQGYGDKFSHALGHSIGLEVHEYPRIKSDKPDSSLILRPGMIFTVEPGIYLPSLGGVRLEDTILITPDGYENLTGRPKKPFIKL